MRKIWDIHGGVHPPENKTQSLGRSIEPAGIPPQLIHPLSQHIGAPAAPIVEVGQRVLKGQMIAEAKGFVSVPIHAASSGTVSAIESREIPHPSGLNAPCIVIDTDGLDEWAEHEGVADYQTLDKSALLTIIRNAGIAGMGGAGFPSAVKLSTREDAKIDTLIINGTECEPYITADDILMRERADQIIAGVKVLQHLIQPSEQTLIGVEDNKTEGIAALRAAAEGSIEVVVFPTKYPSGGEKQLIQILTGREVPSGGLPADVGIVCQNIGTCVAIHRAVSFGEPLISRITTVTGDACSEPGNFDVLLGTPVDYLLTLGGFNKDNCTRLVMGGPMMGFTLKDSSVPVVKTTNCLLAPTKKELPPPPPAQACIRCGMCAEACPASLLPQQMYWFARGKEYEKLEDHNLFDCIECGACSYACPSNIPLVQYYRASKSEIRKQQLEKVKSEHAKARFEARQERIEREEAEKEARRKARQEAAKKKAAAGIDPVSAAQAKAASVAEKDPAQAAIEKAMAKRDGKAAEETPEETLARLEKAAATAEKRLESAGAKLKEAQDSEAANLGALQTAHDRMTEKLAQAKAELSLHLQSQSSDPAEAAIARAQAAREKAAEQSPFEKAEQLVTSLDKRLAKSEQKLSEAKAAGSETAEVLEKSTETLREKLNDARANLAALSETQSPAPAASDTSDPAQLAIERAKASREAAASLSPEQKAQKALESLEARVTKTREKLTEAETEGADTVTILRDTLAKLEEKLTAARDSAKGQE